MTKPLGRISIVSNPEFHQRKDSDEQVAIMTVNLCHDWPRYRKLRERLECFVELVKEEGADILLLQELARTQEFKADEWLSDQLGMAYVYSRANGHESGIGFEEGLAVFSRFPISQPRLAQLSDQKNPFYRRIALGATINTKRGEFLAVSVHLAINQRKNQSQFSRLQSWIDEQSGIVPTVIGGDFNVHEHSPQIRFAQNSWHDSYREINPRDHGYTHNLQWPWGGTLRRSRLDYLFLRKGEFPWRINEARHIEMDGCSISDHKPVLVKARIENLRVERGSDPPQS
ncbi:MAG: endonuclease/exonuclease/phosphatase family protein [Candidatus Kariarchaeaceae archaeon]